MHQVSASPSDISMFSKVSFNAEECWLLFFPIHDLITLHQEERWANIGTWPRKRLLVIYWSSKGKFYNQQNGVSLHSAIIPLHLKIHFQANLHYENFAVWDIDKWFKGLKHKKKDFHALFDSDTTSVLGLWVWRTNCTSLGEPDLVILGGKNWHPLQGCREQN